MYPILFHIGAFPVATYGVLTALAYLLAIGWLATRRSRMGLKEDEFWTLIYWVFFGAIAGGKLLYLAVEWHEYPSEGLELLQNFRYGFVFYGGLIGGILAGAWALRRFQGDRWKVADYCAAALPLGHWIGRLGCLSAGCCYGRPTPVPWAVVFKGAPMTVIPPKFWGIPVHPTQLYEAAYELATAIFLILVVLPRIERGRLKTSTAFWGYLLIYSIFRFTNEFYRGDDRGGLWLSLSVSQWIALGFLVAALSALWKKYSASRPIARA